MGEISVHRNPNDCGKNSMMDITITDINGKTKTDTVANGKTAVIPVEDGDYTVFVEHGVKSNIVPVTVKSNTVALTATIIPDQTKKIAIEKIVLQ
jgi:hypothetical protein